MIGARARHLFEEIVLAKRLNQANFYVLLRQCERQAQADRTGANNDHATGLVVHASSPPIKWSGSLTQDFATTSLVAPIQPLWVRSKMMPSGSLYFAS